MFPVAAAYLLACGTWLLIVWRWPRIWPEEPEYRSSRPWVDLALAAGAVISVFALGQLYRQLGAAGWLPPGDLPVWRRVSFSVYSLAIFSPLFILLAVRRQPLSTVFLSSRNLPTKLALGLALAILATTSYLGLRGDLAHLPLVLRDAAQPGTLENVVAVFLEGVGLAFLFVRLRWTLGATAAILVPALLFAGFHIPRQIADGADAVRIGGFFVFNTILPAAILYTAARARDVIWLGIVHYVMDVAIRAFD